jgi:3'(2'), 5'-bisphosphate nucleotidase
VDYESELNAAIAAAKRAGDAILELYRTFTPIANAPADISTEADRQSQRLIIEDLQGRFFKDRFCAEEDTGYTAPATPSERTWVVDPIDGTRGFATKNGEFSVMIGLLDHGQVVLGVVLEPARRRLCYAVRAGGCWTQDSDAALPLQCRVSRTGTLSEAILTQSHSKRSNSPNAEVRALGPRQTLETYSAGIKLAQIARGEADLYLNTYPEFHDWDICAGHVLVLEAGGEVTGLRGEPVIYGRPGAWQRNGLMATNGALHQRALEALSRGQRGEP